MSKDELFNSQFRDRRSTNEILKNELMVLDLTDRQKKQIENISNEDVLKNLLALPWGREENEADIDIDEVRRKLDESHYGMEKLKDEIIKYIIIKLKNNIKTNKVICLYGSPGVGKTSIAKSIADAIGYDFKVISMGGIDCKPALKGFSSTYKDSKIGMVMEAFKNTNSRKKVILIDEIDKKSTKEDLHHVISEIIDPTLNSKFIDSYLEVEYDLSDCIFILTANDMSKIPDYLLDRLEIFEINDYTLEEKIQIAKNICIPKLLKLYKIKKLNIEDDVIIQIIKKHCFGSQIRGVVRMIEKLISNYFCMTQQNKIKTRKINIKNYEKILDLPKKKMIKQVNNKKIVGRVNGMSVISRNGSGYVSPIDAVVADGDYQIKESGNVVGTLKESIRVIERFIVTKKNLYDLDLKLVFVHFSEMGVAKNGSSAGIAVTTAIISALKNIPISQNIAFTGEIGIIGDIKAVAGVDKKIMASYYLGMTEFIIPKQNEESLDLLDDDVRKNIKVHLVSNYDEVYELLFKDK